MGFSRIMHLGSSLKNYQDFEFSIRKVFFSDHKNHSNLLGTTVGFLGYLVGEISPTKIDEKYQSSVNTRYS